MKLSSMHLEGTSSTCVVKRSRVTLVGVILMLLAGPAWSRGVDGADNQIPPGNGIASDNLVPGEAAPPPTRSHDAHPWTILEQLPAVTDPRAAVEPEKLDSPRALMWSLGRALHEYHHILSTEGRTYDTQDELDWIQRRIANCFDLSDLGPQFRLSEATDAAVDLRGIMLRVPLADWDTLPDAAYLKDLSEEDALKRYRFLDVPIELVLIESGDRAGEWVISQDTRKEARAGWNRMRSLTPIAGTGDMHRLHFFEPGWLIPSSLVRTLPGWAGWEIGGQALWQWVVLVVSSGVLAGIFVLAGLLVRRKPRHARGIGGRILNFLFLLLLGTTATHFIDFLQYQVFLSGIVLEICTFVGSGVMLMAFTLAILTLGVVIAEIIIASPKINPHGLDAAMIRVTARTVSIIVAAILFFRILEQLGFSASTLLAGAGVTGLAVALAAQDTLKNFFASIILLLERPFREGDRIRIGNDIGTVETIGLRSTSIRIRDGNVVFLPNETVSHGRIENISRRPHIRCEVSLGLVYSTTPKRMQEAVNIVRTVIEETVDIPVGFSPMVFFTTFDESALKMEATYWQATTNYQQSRERSQEVNLTILERFNQAGLEFAFPTVTIVGEPADDPPPPTPTVDSPN